MKNNITVLLLYFENKGGAVAGETNLLLIHFFVPTGFVKVPVLWFLPLFINTALSNQHFYCEYYDLMLELW